MYQSFYKLSEKPFSLLPDPHFLFHSAMHDKALTQLQYSLQSHAGFCVITGDIGTGKTTLIRYILQDMEKDITLGLISNTHQSFGELIEWIAAAFNLSFTGQNKASFYKQFMDFLIAEYAAGRHTVLMIDEAQNMSLETLEELRVISNINADKHQVIQIILVGQLELKEKLMSPEMLQFAQRVTASYQLKPLSEADTLHYIQHRVKIAQGDDALFDAQACHEIYRFSGGVPRLINSLCDTALVYGYASQKTRIDKEVIAEVAHDKNMGGLFPLADVPEEFISSAAVSLAVSKPIENDQNDADESHEKKTIKEKEAPTKVNQAPETPDKEKIETQKAKPSDEPGGLNDDNSERELDIPLDQTIIQPRVLFGKKTQNQSNSKIKKFNVIILMLGLIYGLFISTQSDDSEKKTSLKKAEVSTLIEAKPKHTVIRLDPNPLQETSTQKPSNTIDKKDNETVHIAEKKPGIRSDSWILKQKPDHYTLHLSSLSSLTRAENFIKGHNMQNDAAYFSITKDGRTWYSVIYGLYANTNSANEALKVLDKELLSAKPWIRQFSNIQQKIKQYNESLR